MTRYDLSEYADLGRSLHRGARWGFGTFALVSLALVSYGVYQSEVGPGLNLIHLVGIVLVYFILGLFLFIALAFRLPARALEIDDTGFRLEFEHGAPYVRKWNDPRLRITGERTRGAGDSLSRGRPRWSVYGPMGGFSESFIPEAAFDQILRESQRRNFLFAERAQTRPGWYLYTLTRPQITALSTS